MTFVRRSRVVTLVRRSRVVTNVRRSIQRGYICKEKLVHSYMLKTKCLGYNKKAHGEWLHLDPPDVDAETGLVLSFPWL